MSTGLHLYRLRLLLYHMESDHRRGWWSRLVWWLDN